MLEIGNLSNQFAGIPRGNLGRRQLSACLFPTFNNGAVGGRVGRRRASIERALTAQVSHSFVDRGVRVLKEYLDEFLSQKLSAARIPYFREDMQLIQYTDLDFCIFSAFDLLYLVEC